MTRDEAGRCADQVWRVVRELYPVGARMAAARRLVRAFTPGADWVAGSDIIADARYSAIELLAHFGNKKPPG